MSTIVTLTSDFTLGSPYVAQMKARILSVSPSVTLVDLCHDVPPQDILRGALVLEDSALHFPLGSIHVAVVDPGVGTARRLLAFELAGHRFVGPDNGLFEGLLRHGPPGDIVALTEPRYWNVTVSNTFHGRDIMGPVAGHLAAGVPLDALGPRVAADSLVRFVLPEPVQGTQGIEGQLLYGDSFGNLVSNVRIEDVAGMALDKLIVEVAGRQLCCVPTYGAAAEGEFVALFGSSGRLEVAKVNGSAAAELIVAAGARITVRAERKREK